MQIFDILTHMFLYPKKALSFLQERGCIIAVGGKLG